MTKIYQITIIILVFSLLVCAVMYNYKSTQADKYKYNWEMEKSRNENLQGRINANVEASKQKEKLEKKIDSSKDIDNLNHVPDADVLEQLRSDTVYILSA